MLGCSTPSDCSAGSPTSYECLQGVCSYIGCAVDASVCSDGTSCVISDDQPWRGDCVLDCTVQSDCGVDAALDCVGGGCRYIGCPNDAYCAARGDEYDTCRSTGVSQDFCADSCTTDSECDPDFPADTVCGDKGWCVVAECESDAQCADWWGWENPRCVRWDYQRGRVVDE